MRRTEAERFWSKVDGGDPSGCWLWTASLDNNGYGQFRAADGRTVKAYRWAYETVVGPISSRLELDHLCRVPACVRPDHLEPVTHAENLRRSPITIASVRRSKTECKRGHPYDDANTIVRADGGRDCRACANQRNREYLARRRARS